MLKIKNKKDNKKPVKSDKTVITVCVLLASVIFVIDSLTPLGVAGGVPYILIVLISLWSHKIKLPVYMSVSGSILTVLGFFFSPPGGELWKVLANRSLALFAIWAVAILSIQRIKMFEQKEKALSEVKILSGLLPICAACKKIRDDKGYWNRIESYIGSHSEAEFTHGICPDCVEELYGDIGLKKPGE